MAENTQPTGIIPPMSSAPTPLPTNTLAVTLENLRQSLHQTNVKLLAILTEKNTVMGQLIEHGYDVSTNTLPFEVPWSIDFQNLLLKKEYLDKVLELNISYLRYLEGVQDRTLVEVEEEERLRAARGG